MGKFLRLNWAKNRKTSIVESFLGNEKKGKQENGKKKNKFSGKAKKKGQRNEGKKNWEEIRPTFL